MARFIGGVLVGLFLGASVGVSVSAWAAGVFGSGTLKGWTVTKGGEEVCSDPDVDVTGKEIECD